MSGIPGFLTTPSNLNTLFRGAGILDLSNMVGSLGGSSVRYGTMAGTQERAFDSGGPTPFHPEVTVEEDHTDDLTITEHPVESGAAITDHAFKRPAEVRVRVGWSDRYVGGPARKIYQDVLTLQQSRRPFVILTGKREYTNMLVASIRTQTNSGTEFSFVADIDFRQIILVSTQTVPYAESSANRASPEANAVTGNTGQTRTTPVSMTDSQLASAGYQAPQLDTGFRAVQEQLPL
jgi:hypothetical protein